MNDPRDYKLDLSVAVSTGATSPARASTSPAARPFLSVHFACCGVYQRIYRNLDAKRYDGRCPRCGKTVRFDVGASGTESRSFVVE